MPVLVAFLRNYGLREYGITLGIAAVCGLGVAAFLNASAGNVSGGAATLKTKAQIDAQSSRILSTRVTKAVRASHPVRHRRTHVHRQKRSHAKRHHAARTPAPSAPVPKLVAVRTPAPTPAPAPQPVKVVAPKPVVRAPAPKRASAPKKTGGGSLQFDDSG
jgi:hypothetical protein